MLLTQKHIMASHNLMFPNPERLPKVCVFLVRDTISSLHAYMFACIGDVYNCISGLHRSSKSDKFEASILFFCYI